MEIKSIQIQCTCCYQKSGLKIDDSGELICEYCGTIMSTTDKNIETDKLLEIAKKLFSANEYVFAEKYYRVVLGRESNNVAALLGFLLSQSKVKTFDSYLECENIDYNTLEKFFKLSNNKKYSENIQNACLQNYENYNFEKAEKFLNILIHNQFVPELSFLDKISKIILKNVDSFNKIYNAYSLYLDCIDLNSSEHKTFMTNLILELAKYDNSKMEDFLNTYLKIFSDNEILYNIAREYHSVSLFDKATKFYKKYLECEDKTINSDEIYFNLILCEYQSLNEKEIIYKKKRIKSSRYYNRFRTTNYIHKINDLCNQQDLLTKNEIMENIEDIKRDIFWLIYGILSILFIVLMPYKINFDSIYGNIDVKFFWNYFSELQQGFYQFNITIIYGAIFVLYLLLSFIIMVRSIINIFDISGYKENRILFYIKFGVDILLTIFCFVSNIGTTNEQNYLIVPFLFLPIITNIIFYLISAKQKNSLKGFIACLCVFIVCGILLLVSNRQQFNTLTNAFKISILIIFILSCIALFISLVVFLNLKFQEDRFYREENKTKELKIENKQNNPIFVFCSIVMVTILGIFPISSLAIDRKITLDRYQYNNEIEGYEIKYGVNTYEFRISLPPRLVWLKNGQKVELVSISEKSFSGCDKLYYIVIPKSIKTIQESAFIGCEKLCRIYYEGTEEDWNNITILSGNDALKNENIYYLSENEPTSSTGRYWKYSNSENINGYKDILVWQKSGTRWWAGNY